MFKNLKYGLLVLTFLGFLMLSNQLSAAPRNANSSYKYKPYNKSKKTNSYYKYKPYIPKNYTSNTYNYTKKGPYEGYGELSKVNRLPKTHIVSGHGKRTNKGGYTYVNPYARSK